MTSARSTMHQAVRDALRDTVFLLKLGTDGPALDSDLALARRLGLTRDVITNTKNQRNDPSLGAACLIAEAASQRGIDLIADAFSIDGKRTVPDPDGFHPNRSLAEENKALAICNGLVNLYLDMLDFHQARQAAYGVIRAGHALLAEIDAVERYGPLPMVREAALYYGDGLPAEITLPTL